MDQLLYSRADAAARLCIHISTLDMLIARGLIASRKLGRKRVIPHAALISFSQKNLAHLWPAKTKNKTVRVPAAELPLAAER